MCLTFLPVHQESTAPCSPSCIQLRTPPSFWAMCVEGFARRWGSWSLRQGFVHSSHQSANALRSLMSASPQQDPPYPHFQSFHERSHFILPSQMTLSSDIQLIQADILYCVDRHSLSNGVDEGRRAVPFQSSGTQFWASADS